MRGTSVCRFRISALQCPQNRFPASFPHLSHLLIAHSRSRILSNFFFSASGSLAYQSSQSFWRSSSVIGGFLRSAAKSTITAHAPCYALRLVSGPVAIGTFLRILAITRAVLINWVRAYAARADASQPFAPPTVLTHARPPASRTHTGIPHPDCKPVPHA